VTLPNGTADPELTSALNIKTVPAVGNEFEVEIAVEVAIAFTVTVTAEEVLGL
jgi:hypothetical protein